MTQIRRSIEGAVAQAAQAYPCILLTGAPGTGKTALLERLFPEHGRVPLNDPFAAKLASEGGQAFMQMHTPPVCVDDLQCAPELLEQIRAACERAGAPGQFCLSGTRPEALAARTEALLPERARVFEVSGLSLRELQGDSFDEAFLPTAAYIRARAATAREPEALWRVIHRGGLPALQREDADWEAYFGSYLRTYLEREVRAHVAVENVNDFLRFMVAAAARTGQVLNYSVLADEIGRDLGTAKNWMEILEATGVAYLLEPFAPEALKRAVRTPKLYFRDTGLAAYLTRWLTPETLAMGAMSEALFKTFVVGEVIKSYANRGLDWRERLRHYRGRDRKRTRCKGRGENMESQIDLVIEDGDTLYPVAIERNPSAAEAAACAFPILERVEDRRLGPGAVLCLCAAPETLRDGVSRLPVWFV